MATFPFRHLVHQENVFDPRITVTVLVISVTTVTADYQCLCSYNKQLAVYNQSVADGQPVGYMYEFECMPLIDSPDHGNFVTIIFEHQVQYKILFVIKFNKIRIHRVF